MNQEEIEKIESKGINVPKRYLENTYILVEIDTMLGLMEKCNNLKSEGKKPVVVFDDGFNSVWMSEGY